MKPAAGRLRGIELRVLDRVRKEILRDRNLTGGGMAAFVVAEHLLGKVMHDLAIPPIGQAAAQFVILPDADRALKRGINF